VRLRAFAAVVAVIVGLTVFTTGTQTIASDDLGGALTRNAQTFAAGRYIVHIRDDFDVQSVLDDYWMIEREAEVYSTVFHGFSAQLTSDHVTLLTDDPRVLSLTEDITITNWVTQNRTITSSGLWGLDRIDQATLPLNSQFTSLTSGEGAYVYVVDSGIRTTHTQFSGRVLPGYFASGFSSVEDCDGHGTHVSGTVLGSTYGVAPSAKLIPVRVLDCDGEGTLANVVAALDWIALDTSRRPAVVNLSLGGSTSFVLDTAVANLVNSGLSVVAAAGNEAQDACNVSPARAPSAITVAASTSTDAEAPYSNYGTCVDVLAPGSGVLSAYIENDSSDALASGTSMATPHVAGVVALMLESNPCATPAQITTALISNSVSGQIDYAFPSDPVQSPNQLLQLGSISGTPCAPKSVSADQRDSGAVVTWTLPTGLGGSTEFTYSVSTVPTSAGCVTTLLTCEITGLINGQTYVVSVTATNEYGTSATAATTTVTPEGVPIAPTISGIAIGDASATVSWGSVPSTSTVSYTATAQPGGQSCTTTALSCVISGLTNGATYTFTVVAANVSGSGSASSGSVTTLYTAPPAPVVSRIRTKSKQITMTWTALSVSYTPSYRVQIVGTNKTCTTTATSCSISRLVNGKRYRLTVTATNVVGDGQQSVRTPYVVPGINVLRSSIPRKKKILLSKFITTLSAGRKSYSITKGACKISSGYLVAPRRAGSCTLRLSVSASGAYPSMYNTVNIKVT
jgi:subtilisin family serine protease